MNTLTITLATSWASFVTYLVWFLTSAKCNVTITFEDAKALWHIHKKNTRCTSRKWRPIQHKNGKISGFECECGFKYTQKRPIISNKPKNNNVNPKRPNRFVVVLLKTVYCFAVACLCFACANNSIFLK